MKLLYTNFHEGDGGGHTTYVAALARGLANRHEVHVAAPGASRLHREASGLNGVRALAQPFPNGLRQWPARRAARRQLATYLRAHDFDVVHVNGSADHRLVMAALRGMGRKPKIVLTKHNSKPMRGLGHWWRARRGTDQVIAVCNYTLLALQASAYRRCRLDTVHNGVDIDHFAPRTSPDENPERRRWAGDSQVLLLGSSAGTAAYKGWMNLVEALRSLPAAARAQVHVLIAGKPPTAEQIRRIETLGLARQIYFPGLLEDVRPAIAAIDAGFVLSYEVETISFACREMMAMGKPVLVTDYAGLPENIESGRDGWIVPPRDVAAIAAAVQRMLEQRTALPAMGEAAREHALREFGLSRFIALTEAVYLRLLAPRAI